MSATPLTADDLVLDLSSGIAGGYCTKILADAGALVLKLEDGIGDPLRTHTPIDRSHEPGTDSALFQFLSTTKRSIVLDPLDPVLDRLLTSARIIVWSGGSALAAHATLTPSELARRAPQAAVVAITPFGLDGPWADRPATEFTVQALSGAPGERGARDRAPVAVGGDIGEWVTAMIAAAAALCSRWRIVNGGSGELVDVSMLESQVYANAQYPVTWADIRGVPRNLRRMQYFPGIEATRDGFVAFQLGTAQQWLDFCILIDRPDLLEDESLIRYEVREQRREELGEIVETALGGRTTQDLLDVASALRIPCAPVGNGATIPEFDHFVERGAFVHNPAGFVQPTPSWRSSTFAPAPMTPAPRLGEHHVDEIPLPSVPGPTTATVDVSPFAGLRVADFTQFWAGPIVGHLLSMLRADVIHIESPGRPDLTRPIGAPDFSVDQWWEYGPWFHSSNTNKRSFAVDVSVERGREAFLRLISTCDVLVENWTPRVFDNLGLDEATLRAARPDLIVIRMPGFGVTGPWRDRGGYTQQIEAVSGLIWLTGYADRAPDMPASVCDPIAGTHATIALLLALEHRRTTGEGSLIESPMAFAGINVGAEQVIEYSAHGHLLMREGNRSPFDAPQGMYLAADVDAAGVRDRWVAVSVRTLAQWHALRDTIGACADAELDDVADRRRRHDELDAALSEWIGARSAGGAVEELVAHGVPAAVVTMPHEVADIEQLVARGTYERVTHPVVGPARYVRYPARFERSVGNCHRRHAPLMGEHNHELLAQLGYSADEIDDLARAGVIAQAPRGS